MNFTPFFAASALLLAATFAQAQGDATQGKALFATQCGFCHSPDAGKNLMGPSLHNVFGRAGATASAFSHSAALQNTKGGCDSSVSVSSTYAK